MPKNYFLKKRNHFENNKNVIYLLGKLDKKDIQLYHEKSHDICVVLTLSLKRPTGKKIF